MLPLLSAQRFQLKFSGSCFALGPRRIILTMTERYQSFFCNLVIARHRSGITADHLLRQGINLNTTVIQVAFYLVPIGRLAQVLQQMAQPVVTKIQRLDSLRRQMAQGWRMPLRKFPPTLAGGRLP